MRLFSEQFLKEDVSAMVANPISRKMTSLVIFTLQTKCKLRVTSKGLMRPVYHFSEMLFALFITCFYTNKPFLFKCNPHVLLQKAIRTKNTTQTFCKILYSSSTTISSWSSMLFIVQWRRIISAAWRASWRILASRRSLTSGRGLTGRGRGSWWPMLLWGTSTHVS